MEDSVIRVNPAISMTIGMRSRNVNRGSLPFPAGEGGDTYPYAVAQKAPPCSTLMTSS